MKDIQAFYQLNAHLSQRHPGQTGTLARHTRESGYPGDFFLDSGLRRNDGVVSLIKQKFACAIFFDRLECAVFSHG